VLPRYFRGDYTSKQIRRVEESFLPGDNADLPVRVTLFAGGHGEREGGFGKIHLTGTRRLLWSPGGLLPLSPAGTGRQLRARAKDEPGGYLFSFCRQTHRAWSIRMAIRFETTQEKRGKESASEKKIYFQSLAPGLLIGIKRQVGIEVRKNAMDRLTRLRFLRRER